MTNGVYGNGNTFQNCLSLLELNLSNIIGDIAGSSLRGCTKMEKVVIGEGCTEIGQANFWNGNKAVVVMLGSTPPTLAQYNTEMSAVYVPDEALSAYQTAQNWSSIAPKIKPLSVYNG